jgi:ABC-type nickel/cobalt efflux system permease component RcnA
MDPFADPHLTVALYSVGIALAVTVLVHAGVTANHYSERERHVRHGKKWWRK